MKFTFNMKQIRESGILEWAKTHECKIPYVDEKAKEPILWLVKDDGAYLMPGTVERMRNPEGVEPACVVIYAEGFGPDDGYIGGDDFAEAIPVAFVERCKTEFSVILTPDTIALEGK